MKIESSTPVICDLSSAMDLMASLWSEENCPGMLISREAITASFFDLRSGLAGDVMQKFATYRLCLAIWGDFSAFTAQSKALSDFIYESNQGNHICFVATEEAAADWLLRRA